MKLVESVQELQGLLASVWDLGQRVVTNFYLDTVKHGIWIRHKVLYYTMLDGVLFLFKEGEKFPVSRRLHLRKRSLSCLLCQRFQRRVNFCVVGVELHPLDRVGGLPLAEIVVCCVIGCHSRKFLLFV